MTELRVPKRRFYGDTGNRLVMHLMSPSFGAEKPRALAEGERYLGQFILPSFQRKSVWTLEQKIKLIESIYMGLPIGVLVYNFTVSANVCDLWLLDGQQRLTAILEYVDGEFEVYGVRYPDLTEQEKAHFLRINIPTIQTSIYNEDACRDIYDRLVYGGTAHPVKEPT